MTVSREKEQSAVPEVGSIVSSQREKVSYWYSKEQD